MRDSAASSPLLLLGLSALVLPTAAAPAPQPRPQPQQQPPAASPDAASLPLSAIALLRPTAGNTASGTVVFSMSADFKTSSIAVNLQSLKPNTQFAVHFHAFGDISDPAGANVFGHFNPTNKSHACQSNTFDLTTIHAGDIGNITSDAQGAVNAVFSRPSTFTQSATFDPTSKSSILGQGVALHLGADDCKTQPTGNSGGKQATGVLG
ncbi:Copper/zinc superoxide dismutase-domain-containing protein, partial [Zopfochytrium polystomum]